LRLALVILLGLSVFIATSPAPVMSQPPNIVQVSLVGFSLTVSPDNLNVQNGSSANAAIIVTSQGLNGRVNLGASVSPSSGLQAVTDPPFVTVLPGGNAVSTLEINATSAQIGEYKINVTGSAILAPPQSFIVTVHVTGPPSQPPAPPPSSPSPTATSGPNKQPKSPSTPKGQGSQSVFDPVGVIVAGNLLAAVGTTGAIASMYRKRNNPSRMGS
jgi:hypothetical protein